LVLFLGLGFSIAPSKIHFFSNAFALTGPYPLNLHYFKQGCGSVSWKRWKRLNFCGSGSTLKKEAGSGSKL